MVNVEANPGEVNPDEVKSGYPKRSCCSTGSAISLTHSEAEVGFPSERHITAKASSDKHSTVITVAPRGAIYIQDAYAHLSGNTGRNGLLVASTESEVAYIASKASNWHGLKSQQNDHIG